MTPSILLLKADSHQVNFESGLIAGIARDQIAAVPYAVTKHTVLKMC